VRQAYQPQPPRKEPRQLSLVSLTLHSYVLRRVLVDTKCGYVNGDDEHSVGLTKHTQAFGAVTVHDDEIDGEAG
jgi:hypothetical protein